MMSRIAFSGRGFAWALCSIGMLSAMALASCSKSRVSDGTDSTTHWLAACERDAQCGELECLCGVCTESCASDDACAGFAEQAECLAPEDSSCTQAESTCAAECTRDADCSAIGDNVRCGDGRCSRTPVQVSDAGGDGDGDGDGALSCMEREQRSSAAVRAAIDAAELTCTRRSDCVNISVDTDCHASCGSLVGIEDEPAIEAAIAELNATICEGFEESGCDRFVPPCVPPQEIDCVAGHCEWVERGSVDAGQDSSVMDSSTVSSDECLEQAITWGSDGGLVASRLTFALAPCRTFTADEVSSGSPEEVCNNEVPEDGDVTVDDIDALIASADVQAAIAEAPVLYGIDSRPVDGTVFRIDIGGAIIDVGRPCEPVSSSCPEIPEGVAALQGALEDLVAQQHDVVPTCLNTTE